MRFNQYKLIPVAFLFLIFFSCEDYLEKPPSADRTLDVVFSNFQNAEQVLNEAYFLLPTGFTYLDQGAWNPHAGIYGGNVAMLCDEAEGLSTPRQFAMGYNDATINSSTIYPFLEEKWPYHWSAIRSCYLYLENIEKVPGMTSESDKQLIRARKGEALAMIGLQYFEMFKRYGGMPWMNKVYSPVDQVDMTRLSVEATVDSIVGVLDRSIALLPSRFEARDFGRLSKIGAMAVKARLLVFAASPLFNSDETYMAFGLKHLICAPYKKDRWNRAASACKDVITFAEQNGYKLINTGNPGADYKTAWRELDATVNTEVLLPSRSRPQLKAQMYQRAKIYARTAYPGQYHSGIPATQPTQNLVDLYEMKDPSATKDPTKPYVGLDPRFYETILTQGASWAGIFNIDFSVDKANVNQVLGNNNSTGQQAGFCSGYALGKFGFPEVDVLRQEIQIFWPYIRLSDIYLMYAEALNEANSGPSAEAYKYFNEVRSRAGMTPVSGLNYQQMKDKIVNERAVELAFEQVRYWDLKRWKRLDILRGTNYGIQVQKNKTTNELTYVRFEATKRKFPENQYLWAFPLTDVLKAAPNLVQNPGW